MAYLSLYRKYRPQTFADVLGQDHVVQTLQNAIRYGHVANGYLFCGTRGVAKTTIARILAKCLNCIGPDGNQSAPQAEPCNVCSQCIAIQAGQNVDVVELDAASNRSVSDIAKLRESVQFGPMQSRYKVYIVDEAHQLSSDAKDAFLKTLEEPPANVVFVLATTESHAIPITIASRCQQFDFRRGSIAEIAQQCRRVLDSEGVIVPDDALAIVARAADGSYRDALSLLDQVLAYKRDGIVSADVAASLGTVEGEMIDSALSAIVAEDRAALFALAEEIFLQGKDVRQFLRSLCVRIRDLVLIRSGASASGLMSTDAGADAAAKFAAEVAPSALVRMLEIAADAERQTRHSDQHRLLLETTLLKLSFALAPPAPMAQPAPTAQPAQPVRREAPSQERPAPAKLAPRVPDDNGAALPAESPVSAEEFVPGEPAEVLRRLRASWQEVLNRVQVRFPSGAAVVRDAAPTGIVGNTITLEFTQRANAAMMEKASRREAIEKVINRVLKAPDGAYRIKPVAAAPEPATPAARSARSEDTAVQSIMDSDGPTPVLDAVIAEFGGRIVEEDR